MGEGGYDIPHPVTVAAEDTCSRRPTEFSAPTRLLGAQLVGHQDAQVAKRIDIASVALFDKLSVERLSDLDLSYSPPFGSPWDAVQISAQQWSRERAAALEGLLAADR
jgi:hypothetical protein